MRSIVMTKNGNLTLAPCSIVYGKTSYMEYREPLRDTVTDIQMPIGYKLIGNNYNEENV